jgi:hypothetical protein
MVCRSPCFQTFRNQNTGTIPSFKEYSIDLDATYGGEERKVVTYTWRDVPGVTYLA